MSHTYNKKLYLGIGLILAMLSGIMFLGFTQVANAEGRGSGHGPSLGPGHGPSPAPGPRLGHGPSPGPGPNPFMDSRYHHDRAYPARGHYVAAPPRGHHIVTYGHSRYYFSGGVWYRPNGRRFAVVAPPFGLVVPFLPLYYTTLWAGSIPYYYANDVYYTQSAGGYTVVEPPKGEVVEAPAPEEQLFIYPRKGQSEKQQANDRYECHRWAVEQTHYDPTQPPGSAPEAQSSQKRAEYNRAMGACLDARGYTAK